MAEKMLKTHKCCFFVVFFNFYSKGCGCFFFFVFFLISIAGAVGGEHENVYNLNILPLKLKYAFRKL